MQQQIAKVLVDMKPNFCEEARYEEDNFQL